MDRSARTDDATEHVELGPVALPRGRHPSVDDAYEVLTRVQGPGGREVEVCVPDGDRPEPEAELVLCFADVVRRLRHDLGGLGGAIDHLHQRAEDLGHELWWACALVMRAQHAEQGLTTRERIDALATGVVVVEQWVEEQGPGDDGVRRVAARTLNAASLACIDLRLWDLADEMMVDARELVSPDDVRMLDHFLLNRAFTASVDTTDRYVFGDVDGARARARAGLQLLEETGFAAVERPARASAFECAMRSVLRDDVDPSPLLATDDVADVVAFHGPALGAAWVRGDWETTDALLARVREAAPSSLSRGPLLRLADRVDAHRVVSGLARDDAAVLERWERRLLDAEREARLTLATSTRATLAERRSSAERDRLRRLSHEDPLTGLGNRRAYDRAVDEHGDDGRLVLLLLDVDDFKQVNDRHGHAVGDEVLCLVASALRACLRDGDRACRLGGDEFAVVLAARHLAVGHGVAERIRAELAGVAWGELSVGLAVTVSMGVAAGPVGDAYRAADRALYRAKAAGRGMVDVDRPAA